MPTPPEPNNSNMFRTICPGPAAAGVMISMGYGSSNGWMADMPPPTGCGDVWLACWQNVIGWPPNVKIVKPEPPTRTLEVNVGSVPAIDYYPVVPLCEFSAIETVCDERSRLKAMSM